MSAYNRKRRVNDFFCAGPSRLLRNTRAQIAPGERASAPCRPRAAHVALHSGEHTTATKKNTAAGGEVVKNESFLPLLQQASREMRRQLNCAEHFRCIVYSFVD